MTVANARAKGGTPITGPDANPVTVIRAREDRAPTWRQLFKLTATLAELAGLEAPKSAAAASALIGQLEQLKSDGVPVPGAGADGCPF